MTTKTLPLSVPPKGVSDMIDKLSRGVAPNKFLREFVKNAFDAHERGGVNENNKGTITIARDKRFSNKLVIANSQPAEAFTKEIALNYLNTVFNPKGSSDINHGIGAKIAYLPQNPEGILVRCRTAQMSFTLYKDERNIYGLKTETDEADGKAFNFAECLDEEFTFSDSETEVVLMGRTPDDDTWLSTCKVANPRRDSSHQRFAGWTIRDYFNECFWVSPNENVDFKIGIYDLEGNQRAHPAWTRPRYLKSIKEAQKKNKDGTPAGCNGTLLHPDGAKLHYYALKFAKGKKRSTHHDAGYMGYIYEDEVYMNKSISAHERRRKMANAGVITHHKNVSILIEFSETFYLESLLDRSDAVTEDGTRAEVLIETYADYFREHLPDDLKEWMSNLYIETEKDVVKEAEKFYKKQSSAALTALPNSIGTAAPGGNGAGSGGNGNGSGGGGGTGGGGGGVIPQKRRSKSGNSKKHNGGAPEFRIADEGDTEPLVSFPMKSYIVTVNFANPLFEVVKSTFNNEAPEEILRNCVAESIYLNTCLFHSQLIKSYPNESEPQIEDRLSEDKLNALIVTIESRAKDRINRQKANNLKAEQLKEQAAAK